MDVPDAHARPRDPRQLNSARETLVTLGIIVLETNLQLDGLEEVPLLFVEGIIEKGLHVRAHSGWWENELTNAIDQATTAEGAERGRESIMGG